jgi:hypothetical protein
MAEAHASVVATSDAGVVVELRWRRANDPEMIVRYQALKLRDGLIVDMQGYRDRSAARRALG